MTTTHKRNLFNMTAHVILINLGPSIGCLCLRIRTLSEDEFDKSSLYIPLKSSESQL